jgi:hypothetical protein
MLFCGRVCTYDVSAFSAFLLGSHKKLSKWDAANSVFRFPTRLPNSSCVGSGALFWSLTSTVWVKHGQTWKTCRVRPIHPKKSPWFITFIINPRISTFPTFPFKFEFTSNLSHYDLNPHTRLRSTSTLPWGCWELVAKASAPKSFGRRNGGLKTADTADMSSGSG